MGWGAADKLNRPEALINKVHKPSQLFNILDKNRITGLLLFLLDIPVIEHLVVTG